METELLTSVRLACAVDVRVANLLHVQSAIDAFCLQWTLEHASQRGYLRKLDRAHQQDLNPNAKTRRSRFRAGIYTAIKYGYDMRVLQWWMNTYQSKPKPEQVDETIRYAVRFKRWMCCNGCTSKAQAGCQNANT